MTPLDRRRPLPRTLRVRIALAAALALAAGCAASGPSPEEARASQELSAARRASRAGTWQEAAARWAEIRRASDARAREAFFEESRALLALGEVGGAQKVAELGLRAFPDDGGLHAQRGRALRDQGLAHVAESSFERAWRAARGDLALLRELAALRLEIGREEAALELLEPHLGSGRATAGDFWLAARAQRALGRFGAALTSCERGFALEPPSPERLAEAATLYFEPGVRGADARAATLAKAWLARAVALDPQRTSAHLHLGRIAEDEGRDGEAASAYRRAAETDPACVPALAALARVQARRGETEDSIAIARRALALERDPQRREELELLANPAAAAPTPEGGVEGTVPAGGARGAPAGSGGGGSYDDGDAERAGGDAETGHLGGGGGSGGSSGGTRS